MHGEHLTALHLIRRYKRLPIIQFLSHFSLSPFRFFLHGRPNSSILYDEDLDFIHIRSLTTCAFFPGCHVDISIDGYDVGGWALRGGEEMSIERPAYEAKKFTFYRVKTAPKEAGIESGRPENGVVKCVFTPEAFLNIPVITSDSSQPLNVSMPPSATVGDLKRKLQHQMGVMDDPDQVLARSDKVLSNGTRLR